MNSSAYIGTLEFIFKKNAKASSISKIGLLFVFIELFKIIAVMHNYPLDNKSHF